MPDHSMAGMRESSLVPYDSDDEYQGEEMTSGNNQNLLAFDEKLELPRQSFNNLNVASQLSKVRD